MEQFKKCVHVAGVAADDTLATSKVLLYFFEEHGSLSIVRGCNRSIGDGASSDGASKNLASLYFTTFEPPLEKVGEEEVHADVTSTNESVVVTSTTGDRCGYCCCDVC